jgi:hypothetical protein
VHVVEYRTEDGRHGSTTDALQVAGTVRSDDGAAVVGLLGDIVAGGDVGRMPGLVTGRSAEEARASDPGRSAPLVARHPLAAVQPAGDA